MSDEYVITMPMEDLNLVSVVFYIENDKVMNLGEKLNQINQYAYMNGYNWEVLLDYYFSNNHPELYNGIQPDPEAGMFSASFPLSDENVEKINKIVSVINNLVENENELIELVKNHGDQIEWD